MDREELRLRPEEEKAKTLTAGEKYMCDCLKCRRVSLFDLVAFGRKCFKHGKPWRKFNEDEYLTELLKGV